MKKRVGMFGMMLLLGLTVIFLLVYYVWIRGMIYDKGWRGDISGGFLGNTPREVADHFVWCVTLVHFFLFGYLYSVKRYYEKKTLKENREKVKFWNRMEIRCQLGIVFSYYLVWLNNDIVCYFVGNKIRWSLFSAETALYKYLKNKGIIPNTYTWGKEYWNSFVLCLVIAPVVLMFLTYSVHLVYRFIQFKRNNCLSILWVTRNAALLIAIVLLDIQWFQMTEFGEWWRDWYDYIFIS